MVTGEPRQVRAEAVLAVSAARARDAMVPLLRAGGVGSIVVRPTWRSHGPAKKVRTLTTGPRRRGSSYVFGFHWDPVGPAAAAYPSLDAKVAVTPVDDSTSLLSIAATYVPPLGAVGAAVDQLALSRIAQATVDAMLRRWAESIENPVPRTAWRVTR